MKIHRNREVLSLDDILHVLKLASRSKRASEWIENDATIQVVLTDGGEIDSESIEFVLEFDVLVLD